MIGMVLMKSVRYIMSDMNKKYTLRLVIVFSWVLFLSYSVSGQIWQSINGPIESDIRDIEIVGDSVFVVGYEGGIFKKLITDKSWTYIKTDYATNLSFLKTEKFYLAGTAGVVLLSNGLAVNQLFISYDFGKTWNWFEDGLQNCHSVSELLETSLDDVLVGCGSLYMYNDSSKTFQDLLPGIGGRIQFIREINNQVFSGTTNGVFISENQLIDFELFGLDSLTVYDMTERNDSLFFVTSNGISSYFGESWKLYENQDELEFLFIEVLEAKLIVGTEEDIYYFSSLENELTPVFENQIEGTINRIEVHEEALFVATTKGLYECVTETDTCTNMEIPNSFVYSISLSDNDHLFASTFFGLYRYNIESELWDESHIPTDSHRKILSINSDSSYSHQYHFIYTCSFRNSSCNSVQVDSGFPLFDFAIDEAGVFYAASNRKVFRSEDAKVFEEIEFNENRTNRKLFTIGDSLLFIGTNEALIKKEIQSGDTTQIKFNGYGGGHFAHTKEGVIITYASGGLYRSNDFGKTWKKIFNDSHILVDEFISSSTITSDGNSIFLFTTFNRIFVSNNSGTSWGIFEDQFNARVRTSLIKNDESLFVGTWGGGVFEFSLPLEPPITISNEQEAPSTPGTFVLYQNYPNPFNPSTTFSFELNKSESVLVDVYNSYGQQIFSKNLGRLGSGLHSETVNLSEYASGVYFVKVSAGNESQVIKMMLIK